MSRKWAWRIVGAVVYLAAIWLVWIAIAWIRMGWDLGAAVLVVTAAFLILRVHDDDKDERKRRDY